MAKTINKSGITTPYSTGSISGARGGGRDYRTVYSLSSDPSSREDYVGFIPSSEGYSGVSLISNISMSYQMRVTNAADEGTIAGAKGYLEGKVILGDVSANAPFFTLSGNDMNVTSYVVSGSGTKTYGDKYSTSWKSASASLGSSLQVGNARVGARFYFKNEYNLYSQSRIWVSSVKFSYTITVRNRVTFKGDGISPTTQIYNHGDVASFGSTPSRSGYDFKGWNSSLTGQTYTGTLPACTGTDVTYTAVWVKTNTVSVLSVTGGTVTGAGTYASGDSVKLVFTADTGYRLTRYDINDTARTGTFASPYTFTFTITGNTVVQAYFESIRPVFSAASLLYSGKQVAGSNKVPAGQYCLLAVAVT